MADDWIVEQIPLGPGLTKKHGRIDVNYADPRRTDPSLTVPAPHGYTHGVDGSDPIQIAISQVTDLLGYLATLASHHTQHEDGGSDELTLAQSQITGLTAALAALAPLASPTFTGTPAAPTASSGTDTTQIATTAFVHDVADLVLPSYSVPADARKVLAISDSGVVVWVAASGLEFSYIYDSVELYDTAATYDEEFLP